jgi:hypothetical protein
MKLFYQTIKVVLDGAALLIKDFNDGIILNIPPGWCQT